MIFFWIPGTCSRGISTPISPRATMTPSEYFTISSTLSTPSWFSILDIRKISSAPRFLSTFLMARTSSALRINDAATISTPISTPKAKSSRSFSVSAGSCVLIPGRLIPLWLDTVPEFRIFALITPETRSTETTSNAIRPSSMRILDPTSTSSASLL